MLKIVLLIIAQTILAIFMDITILVVLLEKLNHLKLVIVIIMLRFRIKERSILINKQE